MSSVVASAIPPKVPPQTSGTQGSVAPVAQSVIRADTSPSRGSLAREEAACKAECRDVFVPTASMAIIFSGGMLLASGINEDDPVKIGVGATFVTLGAAGLAITGVRYYRAAGRGECNRTF